ncbi:30S ribosomal protein S6 [Petroclostridium sp. X23]|uniref:30S ribosomal protein S6 n=1 Tax=Petroclostridium sp. X23 TaxID=3045146 RepID=UPI0024AE0F8B|nr:30S ribosomal protein S6 [Petroclostridium sp. X23]WHH61721.1 30S ribosomal protein S6 [Petroclostridium sp. X23]
MVNKYETLFIINSNQGEEEITALVEKFKSLIESAGQVENVDLWGKRRLAYPINDLNEGYYVLINFNAETSFIQELERVFKITDGIMRALVIKKDE